MSGKYEIHIEDLPPEMQKQILEEFGTKQIPNPTHPPAIPPAKPREWWQVDGPPVKPVPGTPIVPRKQATCANETNWWEKKTLRGSTRPITPHKVRKKKKSYLWLILLAYALLIGACIIPGLIYQLK